MSVPPSAEPESPPVQNPQPNPDRSRLPLLGILLLAAVLGVAAGGLAVYINNPQADNGAAGLSAGSCTLSDERRAALHAAARGEVAAFAVVDDARAVPAMVFNDGLDVPHSMDEWLGKTVLFNLWATWCAPCREEMPALDRLQANLGGDDFEVVAVSIDTRESADPRGFLEEINVQALDFYQDKTAGLFQDLRAEGLAFGMPTTLLIDDNGCLLGFLAGPAHWDSADAVALMDAARVP